MEIREPLARRPLHELATLVLADAKLTDIGDARATFSSSWFFISFIMTLSRISVASESASVCVVVAVVVVVLCQPANEATRRFAHKFSPHHQTGPRACELRFELLLKQ